MLFNSYEFLFVFLPITLVVFWTIGHLALPRIALAWLVSCSLFFYAWWNPPYLLLLLCSVLFNYAFGIVLTSRPHDYKQKLVLGFGVCVNLLAIGYYKYFNFFLSSLNELLGTSYQHDTIFLPLAISFFTFQQITFLVDSYRGETRDCNFLRYFLFVTFFPQLIAGPIVHHKEMLPQFAQKSVYRFSSHNLSIGFSIFVIGLFKKVVLADGIAVYATPVFDASEQGIHLTFFEGWIGALAYTFQLYFDFSGYSDMAIGLARTFGIQLPLNFNSPYKATNIITFWRRWHITLSRFLRDYLYVSLGGNRKGPVLRYVNLMVTMVLGGLWHGAGWTFILWGTLHGLYLIINHAWISVKQSFIKNTSSSRLVRGISIMITFTAVVIGWVFFRAESIDGAVNILSAMIGMHGISFPFSISGADSTDAWVIENGIILNGLFHGQLIVHGGLLWIIVLSIIVWALPNTQQIMSQFKPALETYRGEIQEHPLCWKPNTTWAIGIGVLASFAILSLTHVSEFLYFQF